MEGKPAGQGRQTQNHPPPPFSSKSESATECLANTIFYGKQFKFNDKAIIELELVVTKCSVCKCVALSVFSSILHLIW